MKKDTAGTRQGMRTAEELKGLGEQILTSWAYERAGVNHEHNTRFDISSYCTYLVVIIRLPRSPSPARIPLGPV